MKNNAKDGNNRLAPWRDSLAKLESSFSAWKRLDSKRSELLQEAASAKLESDSLASQLVTGSVQQGKAADAQGTAGNT